MVVLLMMAMGLVEVVAVTVTLPVSVVGGATTKPDCEEVAVCTGTELSVASTVKELVPSVVGVPAMPPVDEFRLRPAGRAPELME
jgi:hypothetical protein